MNDRDVRPNILVILTDQQRYDSLGCYGNELAQTPNVDALAANGVVFERCYVDNPVCTPSRASIMTGKTLPGHGVYRLYDDLSEDEVLFPQRLREVGYRTGLFGKLHVSSRMTEAARRHRNDGFDAYEWCLEMGSDIDSPFHAYGKWLKSKDRAFFERLTREGRRVRHFPPELHMSSWAAERTIDFIREGNDSQPFFALMSVFDPHNPYHNAPKSFVDRVTAVKPPLAPFGSDTFLPEGLRRELRSKTESHHVDTSADTARREYSAAVSFIDEQIGRVCRYLADDGLLDNTLIVISSDHGDMLGDRGLWTKGAFFFDAGVRVPLVMHWPSSLPGGVRVPTVVQSHDIAATVLRAAGVDQTLVEETMPDAEDLVAAVIEKDRSDAQRYAVCVYRNSGLDAGGKTPYFSPPLLATMICDGRFKLSLYHDLAGATEGFLSDLELDPSEGRNLWADADAAPARARLTEALTAWFAVQDSRRALAGGSDNLPEVFVS